VTISGRLGIWIAVSKVKVVASFLILQAQKSGKTVSSTHKKKNAKKQIKDYEIQKEIFVGVVKPVINHGHRHTDPGDSLLPHRQHIDVMPYRRTSLAIVFLFFNKKKKSKKGEL